MKKRRFKRLFQRLFQRLVRLDPCLGPGRHLRTEQKPCRSSAHAPPAPETVPATQQEASRQAWGSLLQVEERLLRSKVLLFMTLAH